MMLKPASVLKVTLLPGYFLRFLNCTNSTKSCRASQMCNASPQSKKLYFLSLEPALISGKMKFCETLKPLSSEKISLITLAI